MITLILKDILKPRLYRGNNLLKVLTAIFVSMFSLCSAQSVGTWADAGQITKKITRETIPYFVTTTDKDDIRGQILHFNPDADLAKYPLFEYHVEIDRISPLKIGQKVPDEIMDLPIRIAGDRYGRDSVTLRELSAGRMLVLDFWATWCAPCLASMDKWKELQPKYGDHVQSVGLMLDYDYKAELTARKKEWTSPQLIGPEVYLLNAYFCGTAVTGPSAWIKDGILVGITDAATNIEPMLEKMVTGEITAIPEKYMWKSPF
ncbi:TlpA family protein disulfide reductase [Sphingobacterium multivorum]|uniref:TlpA family protein disulfide reductase n=1 Tax=Sphingobacterium multivorum TaxID=28454 RepID=UPI0028ABA947|nr:redoxin family protein [Sphingobacterium multivorum]